MNTKNRTIRAGLAALAMGAAVATATGPAMADIPLTPISSSPSDIAGLATGSGQRENGTTGTGGGGSFSGSASGSGHALDPFARSILTALDYVPCQGLDGTHVNTPLAGAAALVLSLITGEWYVAPGCAS
ncbi:hypothetical protein KHQ06_33230 [Nocardia tengchongensis]|uniref:Uncharacterized protein n=1 Tax=Nocardia tengchongensis TaxID=2055889 RepID=A0ABX8CNC3_9NOCA|nr:hypothetical protein [Nocardia tengchongensis]QVI20892.1 hypothetical protein KHQ06_33230 [Nocardia tengchongensis]